MFVVEKSGNCIRSLPARQLSQRQLRALSSPLAFKVMRELAKGPAYPMELAKRLKIHEQKVYYHIRNLEKARLIEVVRNELVHGTLANVYAPLSPAFVASFSELEQTRKIPGIKASSEDFLSPIIENGEFNGTIIVGSPDPHGPDMARSRDGYYGIDFALFLGTFLNGLKELSVRLDTEVRMEELQGNIIVIGGPVVNMICARINDKLPVRFEKDKNWSIFSSISCNTYYDEWAGIIVKVNNPFNPRKKALIVAGKRYSGTRAVMMAFLRHFDEIAKGNSYDGAVSARIVEGLDRDADGVVDDVRFIE